MAKVLCIGGARPNFMKLAPLVRELSADEAFEVVLVHTGQHYDQAMSGAFFRDLGMRAPDHHLEVGSGSHAQQTAEILKRLEPVVVEEKPDGVLVVGDVNSTLAGALVAKKLGVDVIHVEAGLRSFDRTMPEEINRLATDAITDLFLVTEESGRRNLVKEGVDERQIRLIGNLMIDSLRANQERAEKESGILERLGVKGRSYGVVTLHRPANVDDVERLGELLECLAEAAQAHPLFFPMHPRTRGRMEAAGLEMPAGLVALEPQGYVDFLCLLSSASVVLTDSGGIQEETTALGVPCLTLRDNTERPVTVEEGTNRLAGTSKAGILEAWRAHQQSPKTGRVPQYWDGQAAGRARLALREWFGL